MPLFPGKKILVVEDHLINRELMVGILKLMECEVAVVQDGEEAVAAFQQAAYDLILMDINMPKKDGYQATAEIRELPFPKGAVPIIAVTAYAMEDDQKKCLNAGMNDYISKPIDLDHFERLLKKYLS